LSSLYQHDSFTGFFSPRNHAVAPDQPSLKKKSPLMVDQGWKIPLARKQRKRAEQKQREAAIEI
jgi:hypothetical protein